MATNEVENIEELEEQLHDLHKRCARLLRFIDEFADTMLPAVANRNPPVPRVDHRRTATAAEGRREGGEDNGGDEGRENDEGEGNEVLDERERSNDTNGDENDDQSARRGARGPPKQRKGKKRVGDKMRLEGLARYRKLVSMEGRFLQSMHDGKTQITKARIQCSNVPLYEAIFVVLLREKGLVSLNTCFPLDNKPRAVKVDVVSEYGAKWIKVKATNARNIEDIYEGRGRYGEKSVTELASEYLKCARQNPVHFGIPKVEFVFCDLHEIPDWLLDELRDLGIVISSADVLHDLPSPDSNLQEWLDAHPQLRSQVGQQRMTIGCGGTHWQNTAAPHRQHSMFFYQRSNAQRNARRGMLGVDTPGGAAAAGGEVEGEEDEAKRQSSGEELGLLSSGYEAINPSTIRTVNLDVTALLALSSDLANGGSHHNFPHFPVIQRQAEHERAVPLLENVLPFLEGKDMIVCALARKEFEDILRVVGSDEERGRGAAFLARCRNVEDCPSPAALALPVNKRIKQRQRMIFGTGDTLKALTLTANIGFVRAAAEHGVHFAAFIHPSRALTGQKVEAEAKMATDAPTPAKPQ